MSWANLDLKMAVEKMAFKHGGNRLITVAREKRVGEQLKFTDLGVHIMPSDAFVSREQVKEIRLRQGLRLSEVLLASAEGEYRVKRMLPDKVIRVAP